jgi:hypothetical protein
MSMPSEVSDRHRPAGRDHGRRFDGTHAHRRGREEARQARGHTWLQVEHHHRRQPGVSIATLGRRTGGVFHAANRRSLEPDAREIRYRRRWKDPGAGKSRPLAASIPQRSRSSGSARFGLRAAVRPALH